MRSLLRQTGLGRLAYLVWHRPRAAVARSIAEGGPLEQWRTARGQRAMEAAAHALPPCAGDGLPLEMHVLTGRRFWYQTAFCLWSLARVSGRRLAPVVFDDGTLRDEHFAPLVRLFPAARLVRDAEIAARLDLCLPAARFPVLRARRAEFPLLRKLTDVHAGLTGWKLFVDSDMLFFRQPSLLLDWLAAPSLPLRATDIDNCYGCSLELLGELAGQPVDERVNTGLLGLRSDEIDWDKMEHWCRTLIARVGTHYYQEQALVALLLAGRPHVVAPIADYVTFPQPPEANDCRATMHHYVAGSKRWYFRQNWRRVLASATNESRPGSPTPA